MSEKIQESICCDPVEYFPPEVSINIFKFLSGDNLLTASLVSKDWYELIASTQKCMKKIKVTFKCSHSQSSTFNNIALLLGSTRKYENLVISRCSQCIKHVRRLFQESEKRWKRVRIIRTTFKNMEQTLDFLEGIAETVEELELYEVHITNSFMVGAPRKLKFPKLKALHTRYIHPDLFSEAFQDIDSLRGFEVCSFGQSVDSLNALIGILKANHNLKVLKISGNVYDKIMYHQDVVKEFQFNLEELLINSQYYVSPYHDMVQTNSVLFLESQRQSLKTLTFGDWLGIDALKEAFHAASLRKFTIKGLSNIEEIIDWKKIKMETNKSIFKLSVLEAPDNIEMLEAVTSSLPNLTCFSISLNSSQSVKTTKKLIPCAAYRHAHLL